MRFVETRGATLATQAFGTPAKGTILLVMGATASMLWWPQDLCQTLADAGYQVIRFDHRDTGASTTSQPGEVNYDVPDIANDLIAILDAYGASSAHIVGMSLGAYAGQVLALQHPERVSSLTLISAEPLGLNYESEGISDAFMAHFGAMATLDWSDHAAVADFLLGIAELSAGSAPQFDRAAAQARIEGELARTQSIASAFNHSMLAGEIPPGLSAENLALPVLIIHGTEDPVISVNAARRSHKAIAGSRLHLLAGRGHELAPADLPEIATAILDFITA